MHGFLLEAFLWTTASCGEAPRDAAAARVREATRVRARTVVHVLDKHMPGGGVVAIFVATVAGVAQDGAPPFLLPAARAALAGESPRSPGRGPALSGPEAGRFIPQRSLAPLLKVRAPRPALGAIHALPRPAPPR